MDRGSGTCALQGRVSSLSEWAIADTSFPFFLILYPRLSHLSVQRRKEAKVTGNIKSGSTDRLALSMGEMGRWIFRYLWFSARTAAGWVYSGSRSIDGTK